MPIQSKHKDTKTAFIYITITNRLRTVIWSDKRHQISVVNLRINVQPYHFPQRLCSQKDIVQSRVTRGTKSSSKYIYSTAWVYFTARARLASVPTFNFYFLISCNGPFNRAIIQLSNCPLEVKCSPTYVLLLIPIKGDFTI